MPFTFITFTIGALALAGFPGTSGWFSKDEVLAFAFNRGGWYVVLGVLGYVGALLTAFYSFRMVFRVFSGTAVAEAVELEHGHIAHGEPMNPMTGEAEDTDVGFPGPEHFVAEREWPMKAAMGPLALLAIVGGYVAIPGVDSVIRNFLEPVFADSHLAQNEPTTGGEWLGLVVGSAISILGISLAWLVYLRRPGTTARLVARYPWAHRFLEHKWYFDEANDALFARPFATFGSFGRRVVEADFVQGTIVGGATGIVRAGTSVARAIQTGYLRAYALLLLLGVAGLTLYFLINST